MAYRFKSHYWGNSDDKNALKVFAETIFGLDFTRWEKYGLWDERYIPFSLFDGARVISNVCVYPSRIFLYGSEYSGVQLLTVGTLPDYRRQGLQRVIMDHVLEWCYPAHDFVFLFTEDAGSFYEKVGFRKQMEHYREIDFPDTDFQKGLTKLHMDKKEDFELLFNLTQARVPVSLELGYLNPNLFLFMCLYDFTNFLYHIPDLDIIVIVYSKDDTLIVADIVGKRIPEFRDLAPYLKHLNKKVTRFAFNTDLLGLESFRSVAIQNVQLYTDENFHCKSPFLFPDSIKA